MEKADVISGEEEDDARGSAWDSRSAVGSRKSEDEWEGSSSNHRIIDVDARIYDKEHFLGQYMFDIRGPENGRSWAFLTFSHRIFRWAKGTTAESNRLWYAAHREKHLPPRIPTCMEEIVYANPFLYHPMKICKVYVNIFM